MADGKRDSNIEILRIVSMVFIVIFHIAHHGNWDYSLYSPADLSFNILFLQGLLPLGKLGVDIFVLITGYFLITSTRDTWPKIVKLWIHLLFYSLAISLVFALWKDAEFTSREILNIFTPTISYTWWFATTYLILLALSPFINKALNICDRVTHLKLMIALIVFWSFIPTLMNTYVEYNNLGWFITLYVTAAYVRKYPVRFTGTFHRYALFAAILYAAVLAMIYAVDITGYESEFWNNHGYIYTLTMQNNPAILLIAVFLLLAFRSVSIPSNKVINAVAATMFGVYLIHDHELVRGYIYSDLFDCFGHSYSDLLPLYCIWMLVCIFAICIAIEFTRQLAIDRCLLKKLPERVESFHGKVDKYIEAHLKE